MRCAWKIAIFLVLLGSASTPAAELPKPATPEAKIEALFTPGRDVLDIKLAVDAMADPSAGIAEGRAAIDGLAASLLPMAAGAQGSNAKLQVLRRFLYVSGPWNGGRPFSYDMSDPRGAKPVNRLLTHYVRARLGNCITMPMLAMILGRRIGLKLTLAVAPFHVFNKYTDDAGTVWNLEATSGLGFTRDAWYRLQLPMTDAAVAKGTYLRALSEDENVALMAMLIVEHDMAAKQPEAAIAAVNVILRHDPDNAIGLVWRGSANALRLRRDVFPLIQALGFLPPEMSAYAEALSANNLADFTAAEALGWTEQDGIKQ